LTKSQRRCHRSSTSSHLLRPGLLNRTRARQNATNSAPFPPHPPSLPPLLQAQNVASPKMGPHDLRVWSFEDGCLCSILHGLLQLQIWTAFLLPARLFPTVASQSATQLSHTTFSQLSEPTQESSSTCTLRATSSLCDYKAPLPPSPTTLTCILPSTLFRHRSLDPPPNWPGHLAFRIQPA
jgi:hypothetical protein